MKTSQLLLIQASLKAPKNQKNAFGGYNYRSCEDILEAVKPLVSQSLPTIIVVKALLLGVHVLPDCVPIANI